MSDKLAKEQRRNLKHQIGETAAAAVAETRELTARLAIEHKVLAAQMLDFERTVATVKEGRALDRKHAQGLAEQLEACQARLTELSDYLRDEQHRFGMAFYTFGYAVNGNAATLQQLTNGLTWRERLRWLVTGHLP